MHLTLLLLLVKFALVAAPRVFLKKKKMKPLSRLAHSAGAYPRFLQLEVARSISTPPGRDASPLQSIAGFS